jgi:hypothetical protein
VNEQEKYVLSKINLLYLDPWFEVSQVLANVITQVSLNSGNTTETQDSFVYNCLSYNYLPPNLKLMKLMGSHCS